MVEASLGGDPRLKDVIFSNEFALYLNNQALILAQHWSKILASGAHVTLRILDGQQPNSDKLADNSTVTDESSIEKSSVLPDSRGSFSLGDIKCQSHQKIRLIDSKGASYEIPLEGCRKFEVSIKILSGPWLKPLQLQCSSWSNALQRR